MHEFAEPLDVIIKITKGLMSTDSKENEDSYYYIPIATSEIINAKSLYMVLTDINKKWKADDEILKHFDNLTEIQFLKHQINKRQNQWLNIQQYSNNLNKDAENFEDDFNSMKKYTEECFKLERAVNKKEILKKLEDLQKRVKKEFEIG